MPLIKVNESQTKKTHVTHANAYGAVSIALPIQDKRNKRMRPGSPTPGTPQPAATGSARGSAAPSIGSAQSVSSATLRTGKASASSRASAIPERIEVGRKVAYKAPPKKDPETGRMEAAQWILATVKSFESPNKLV